MERYLIFLLCLLVLVSCVEDEGNYDYRPSRNLGVVGLENFYKLTVGETQVLTPTVIERYDEDETPVEGARIEWFLNDEPVGEGPSYTFHAEKNGMFAFNMKIEDPVTGSISTQPFRIEVQSLYVQGFMVLSEMEGKAALSFLRTKWLMNPDTVLYTDDYLHVFQKNNGNADLQGMPILITENLKNEYSDLCGEISVLTGDGNGRYLQDLNGESLVRETSIRQEFEGEELPDGWCPKQMLHTIWDSFVLNENGKLYIRRAGSGEAYHTGLFSKDITLWNDTRFERLFFTDYCRSDVLLGIELLGDGSRQYVGIMNKQYSPDYNLTRLDISGDFVEDFRNLEDEFLYADWRRGDYEENGLSVVQRTPAGEYILHCFNTGYVGRRSSTVPVDYSRKINLTQELGIRQVSGLCTSKKKNYTYVSDGLSVYWVNNDKGREKWGKMKTFGKQIAAICDQSTFMDYFDYKVSLAVGFEDGTVEVWEISDEDPSAFTRRVYTSSNSFGKIRQILYKCGRSGNYLN